MMKRPSLSLVSRRFPLGHQVGGDCSRRQKPPEVRSLRSYPKPSAQPFCSEACLRETKPQLRRMQTSRQSPLVALFPHR